MKKLPFDELSTRVCKHPGCKKRIKQRLINLEEISKKEFNLCYKHWKSKEHTRRGIGTKRG